jgi:hypothetical protein
MVNLNKSIGTEGIEQYLLTAGQLLIFTGTKTLLANVISS